MRAGLLLLLAALIFHLVLIQPNHPAAMTWAALFVLPLELPAVLLVLVVLGRGRLGMVMRALLVAVLTLIVVLKTADFVMFTALNRGFNPVADLPLVVSFFQLISGALGTLVAVLAVVGAVIVTMLVAALLWWAGSVWARVKINRFAGGLAAVGAVLFAGVAVAEIGDAMGRWNLPVQPPGAAFTARVGLERVDMVQATLADLRAFRAAAANDPYADIDGLLDEIERDVLVIFVESYGRTSFDTQLYADLHLETLRAAQTTLAQAGLSMASTFIASPTQGGQSWLAHATFANGLWVDDQTSYGAVIASGRDTLFHIAQRSGFHTAAVMPQITLEWPEAQFMGFDTILAADDLGYQGLPFNWITMPDQFTFAAMDQLLFDAPDRDERLFVQIALGSSHAPWLPVPDLVDWETLGDGTLFNPIVEASEPPNVVWRDHDRVREQYKLAIDYALQTVFSYAARHADDAPLLIIVGDHQAAGFVALDERADVPVHIIGPRHLVDRISDTVVTDMDFSDGLLPHSNTSVRSMDQMRHLLLRAFSSSANQALVQ
ncbi:MAG: sulfatase-like hydrolase/transferase [Devosiaceae bacterium]